MAQLNEAAVQLVGNVTREPELRFTQDGKPVTTFGLAINRRRRNPQTNEWEDGDSTFFDVTCWEQLAENVAESVPKGARVLVLGYVQQDNWEKDGEKRSKLKVTADEVGPSLRWATVPSIVKNEKRSANGNRANGHAPAQANQGRPPAMAQARSQAAPVEDEYDDPF